jgi:hypothetical protein
MAKTPKQFAISSKLQENMCLLAQSQVFDDAEELLFSTMGIQISAKQIQRVSECYGAEIESKEQTLIKSDVGLSVPKTEELTYIMPDGSMIYTREEGWKEIKVGRIFQQQDIVKIQEDRRQITRSLYVCHLGEHKEFLGKMEHYIERYRNKICVADGAKWIWNWADDTYPEMIQILDYYHAVEKLCAYALLQYPDEKQRTKWIERQKILLVEDKVDKIITAIEKQEPQTLEAEKARDSLLTYYKNNRSRMYYGTYKAKGYLIGSGAIESAHRNVVQQRMKLSGQRWSVKGAQQIVNLRAYKKSDRWNEVVDFIKQAA